LEELACSLDFKISTARSRREDGVGCLVGHRCSLSTAHRARAEPHRIHLGIVIPAHNEQTIIADCLAAVKKAA
jgi:hypothetical protein